MSRIKSANRLFLCLILTYIAVVMFFRFTSIKISMTANIIVSQSMILVPGLIYLAVSEVPVRKYLASQKISLSNLLLIVVFTMLVSPVMTVINVITSRLFGNVTSNMSVQMLGNSYLVNLLLMALLPALGEELVYRGILFRAHRKNGAASGAIISGFLFGLMHMNLNQFSYAFLLGILFAFLVEATGSVWASVAAHFAVNGASVTALALLKYISGRSGEYYDLQQAADTALTNREMLHSAAGSLILSLITVPLAVMVFRLIVKRCGRQKQFDGIWESRKTEPWITPSLAAGCAICFIFILLR